MTEHQTLSSFLESWAGQDDLRRAVAATTQSLAESCCAIAEIIALGSLAGSLSASRGENVDGDTQLELDMRANEIILDELVDAPGA